MKRDMDLIRNILLAIEEKGPPLGIVDIDLPGHTAEEISFHVVLLRDAGLVEDRLEVRFAREPRTPMAAGATGKGERGQRG